MRHAISLQSFFTTRWWNAINRRLNQADVQSICLLILVINALVLSLAFATQVSGRTMFGPQLGADFGAYYIAGKIYNTDSPTQIYERDAQRRIYHELFPSAPIEEELPYLNAPFFILPFTLLAQLNYSWGYLFWVVFSLGIYITGFTLLYRTCTSLPEDSYKTSLLLALSFAPFLIECLAGGQTSAVGFFILAIVLCCEQRGRQLLSGMALSFCLYKPTLLVLIIPMLVLTRRYVTIAGFTVGSGFLALLSWVLVGTKGCQSYLKMLLVFADASASDQTTVLRSWKYIDLNSFFRLLLGDYVYLRWATTSLIFLAMLLLLMKLWWNADHKEQNQRQLCWALTITWTLVLNVYLGIYDATLVVLSVVLMTQHIHQQMNQSLIEWSSNYKLILLLLYLIPWITQPLARLTGVQIFTVLIAIFGGYQIYSFQENGFPKLSQRGA